MNTEAEIIKAHTDLIKQYLSGRITIEEFINLVHDLPKLTTSLPFPAGSMEVTKWD